MRHYSKIIFYLVLSVLLISCGQSVAHTTTTPLPVPTSTPTLIPTSKVTPTITTLPSPGVLPTINPTELPNLLKSALSIETVDILNGHRLRRFTGWDYGYEYAEPYFTDRYQWMDSQHLLLFPKTGEIPDSLYPSTEQKRAVVFNLETGTIWLPNEQPKAKYRILDISLPRWSPEAGVLISSMIFIDGDFKREGVYIFNADGEFVSVYAGKLHGISPSGNKILVDDTWIDLKSKKMVDFAWYFGMVETWLPIWSPDETRVFMCCYFYGNAVTGESYNLLNEDTIFEGKPIEYLQDLSHSTGTWLNDNYVLAKDDGFFTVMSGFEDVIPIFDVSSKTYRSLIKVANLPYDLTDVATRYATKDISPNGDYMWVHKVYYPTGFLIDLKNFRSWEYAGNHLSWVGNGEYAIIDSKLLLVLSSKELKAMPPDIQCNNWHPTKGVCLSLTTNEQGTSTLNFLNAQDMSIQKTALSTPLFNQAIWSPNGDYIILATEDKALWRIDYPNLENMEQLTHPIADMYVESIIWSPDYEYLSFVGGANIYIADINKSQ
ncbi:MAG: hypothetical protein JNK32_04970 [Anaerolineales bacterium]|nr:hypothetical protein [Anaerolineales bacterium]